MKTNVVFFIIIIALITACSTDRPSKGDIAFIDVKKNYPEKNIFLTDIADVTYLHLSTANADYLYKGRIQSITENNIIIYDNVSGSILFFSKDGNPKSRFNRRGQGPEEYREAAELVYDEASDEVFITTFGINNVIYVYSSTGIFKRIITLPQGTNIFSIVDFDDHSLFFYEGAQKLKRDLTRMRGEYLSDDYVLPFYRISKTDGEVLDYVELPGNPLYMGFDFGGSWLSAPRLYVVKCPEGVLLWNANADTIFLYSDNKSLTPVIYQVPSVASLSPMEYLECYFERVQYQFIKVNILHKYDSSPGPLPAKYYMRNKKTGEVVRPKLLLPDYEGKEFAIGSFHPYIQTFYENGCFFELDLYELKQAYRENKLSGKLKELVVTLNEDEDNNVFMLVEFK